MAYNIELIAGTSGTRVTPSNKLVDNADGKLYNAREPLAHADTHASGGSDPVTPAAIGAATAAQGALADSAVQPAGTPASNQLAYWTTAQILAGANLVSCDATNSRIGIGTLAPLGALHVVGNGLTAHDFPGLVATDDSRSKTLSVQGDTFAYLVGYTADKSFACGISAVGKAFAGSITAHDFDLRREKVAKITLTADGATLPAETASRVVCLDANKTLKSSSVTTTELESLTGITGNVKDQLDGKLTAANNLSDLTNSVTALANLGMNYICWPQEMPDSGRFATLTDQKQISLPSASYTASTLSIVGATATITDSAGGIPTASFPVNMTMVTMSGWTNAANNAVQLRVSSVSATTLVLEGEGSETLIDESAGASITLRGVTLSNTSGFFNPYAGSTVKATGVALYDNSTRGGTGGALSPSMLSLLLAMSPTYPWRYMVEFGMIKITSASATNPNLMFINDGKAHFANFRNVACEGYWCRVVGGLGPFVAENISVDGSAYTNYPVASGGYALPDNNWHYIKAWRNSVNGYNQNNAGAIYSTAAGQSVEIACPFFTGCVPISSLKWTSVLITK